MFHRKCQEKISELEEQVANLKEELRVEIESKEQLVQANQELKKGYISIIEQIVAAGPKPTPLAVNEVLYRNVDILGIDLEIPQLEFNINVFADTPLVALTEISQVRFSSLLINPTVNLKELSPEIGGASGPSLKVKFLIKVAGGYKGEFQWTVSRIIRLLERSVNFGRRRRISKGGQVIVKSISPESGKVIIEVGGSGSRIA